MPEHKKRKGPGSSLLDADWAGDSAKETKTAHLGDAPLSQCVSASEGEPIESGSNDWKAGQISQLGPEDRHGIYAAAVEMTRMPMVVTDWLQPDNPIIFVNGAFLSQTRYQENEVLGRNCRLLQGPETDPATVAEMRLAVEEQRPAAVEILNYKADGTPFWNAIFLGPVFDADGKLTNFVASQMDVSHRHISEQAFRQAQKMEAIGQLTAGLAHDFNNLLQIITGNLQLISKRTEGLADSALDKLVVNASGAAHRGGKLTQQLLTFARKQQLTPKRISLNAQVLGFSEMLAMTLGKQIDLRLDLKPGLPDCMLDPEHLEMALLNLLINARDAMPSGGQATVATSFLRIKPGDGTQGTTEKLRAGDYAILCVHDQGSGMSEETLRRATEPFFTTKGPGTGLGLSMVDGFMQQSQGRLELHSVMGEGSVVKLIFPLASVSYHDL